MPHASIDELLVEVNKVANMPTIEDLRRSVTRQLRHVYMLVGNESLFQPGVMVIEPTKERYVDLPDGLIKLIDVQIGRPMKNADGGYIIDNINKYGQFIYGQRFTSFQDTSSQMNAGKMQFHRGYLSQPLTATYYSIPTDELGNYVVDENIFMAAMYFCQFEASRLNLNKKNDRSFSAIPTQLNKQLADTEMNRVRAQLNEFTPRDFDEFYRSLIGRPTSGRF